MKVKFESAKYGFCAPRTFRSMVIRIGRTDIKVGVNGNFGHDWFYCSHYAGPIYWLAVARGLLWIGLVHYNRNSLMIGL